MGGTRYSATSWDSFSASTTTGKSTAEVFKSTTLKADLDPSKLKAGLRESRDSDNNPQSTPLIVSLDVTGSMGIIADYIAREGFNTLFTEIYDRKPIHDPHIMFTAVGDVDYDRVPLQMSQFEADIELAKQLVDIYLEHGGGGNNHETYTAAWYAAAMHTTTDSWEKRHKKGYLFTIGDECINTVLKTTDIKKMFGASSQNDLTADQLFEMASRYYNVYHIIIEQGNYARGHLAQVTKSWADVVGQNLISLSDYKKLAETIISVIQIQEGEDAITVTKSWSGDTSLVVADAVKGLVIPRNMSGGLVRL